MTQDERWLAKYNEVKSFIETNKRNPSKHRIEEHDYLNWLKANRKALNAGKMKLERMEMFGKLKQKTAFSVVVSAYKQLPHLRQELLTAYKAVYPLYM